LAAISPPKGWAFCDGSLLPIAQNSALFSILGVMYGGNGTTTFALPDLRGRVPIGMGQGLGLSNYVEGQAGGQEFHTLVANEIPVHTHAVTVSVSNEANTPQNRPAAMSSARRISMTCRLGRRPRSVAFPRVRQVATSPHENRQPYLAVNYIIALVGIYPSRG
jgi:microcystin-dependent protein